MSMTFAKEVRDVYVWFGLSGPSDAAELMRFINAMGRDVDARALSAIVIDVRQMENHLTTSERFALGEVGAAALFGIRTIALVQEADEKRGFVVMVASNRGTAAESFTSLEDAEAWLRG
jgi:hypothetical protein